MRHSFGGSITNYACLCFIIGLFACEKESDIGYDLHNTDEQFKTYFTDTTTVLTSTVLVDSIPTSGTNYLMAGRYVDDRLGKITGKSFFQLGLTDNTISLGDAPIFDSLVFMLDYAYSYGDTTQTQQLSVYQLTKKLDETQTYYNSDQVAYESTPLATQAFRASPGKRKPLRIRLPDALGQALVMKAVNSTIATNTYFQEYIKGLALVPGESDNAAVLGFRATSDSTVVKLYYHRNESERVNLTYDFKVSTGTQRFHQLKADRSGTLLSSLQRIYQSVDSKETADEAYVEAGIGLRTRIDFPYLSTFNGLGHIAINSADLVIRPVAKSFGGNTLPPSSLSLYIAYANNRVGSLLSTVYTDLTGTASYVADEVNVLYYYKFPLTSYINTEIRNNVRSKEGLFVAVPETIDPVTVQRLILGSNQHPSQPLKLELVYTLVKVD
jgi:hypothetical protein